MKINPLIRRSVAASFALLLPAVFPGCTLSDKETLPKNNGREIDIHATPVDPLAAQRSPPVVPITNVHEHLMSETEVKPLLEAMERVGVERTVVLGSPMYTFALGMNGFTHYDQNNRMLLQAAKEHPERIVPFVVLYAQDKEAPQKLRDYIEQGAKGVKLFSGHGASHGFGKFHTMPLDDPRLEAVYQIIEEHELPVLFHVNYTRFADEFDRVLTAHPKMRVLCPHFCLTLRDTRKVDRLLNTFPNLWMDVSFGWIQFQAEGYRRIDKKPELVRAVIEKHPERFTFGSDLVLTNYEKKDADWITMNMSFYRDVLERESYSYYGLPGGPLTGLALSEDLLTRIYRDNAAAWLDGPASTDIPTDPIQKDPAPSE